MTPNELKHLLHCENNETECYGGNGYGCWCECGNCCYIKLNEHYNYESKLD